MLRLLFFLICATQLIQNTEAESIDSLNTIHFSSNQLSKKEGMKLNSNWNFYWNQLLAPGEISEQKPSHLVALKNWTNFTDNNNEHLPSLGYATYHLHFSVDEEASNLSLYVPRIIGSYKLWINGNLAMELGKVGTSKSTTLHRRFVKVVPLNSSEKDFEIVIQVANFYNKKGGIDEPILLGKTSNLLMKQALHNRIDMVFIGSLSFIGILFLVFFFIFWNKDKAILYFAMLCLAMAYHTLNDHYAPLAQIFENLSWIFATKTEYLAAHLIGISGSFFFAEILSDFIHKWYRRTVLVAILFISVLVIVLPGPYFTQLIVPYLILLLLNVAYVVGVSFFAIKSKTYFSKLLIVCLLSAAIIFSVQIVSYIYDKQQVLVYVKFGDIILFLSISFLLMQRFSNSFKSLEVSKNLVIHQKKELQSVNQSLTESVTQLENSNKELDDFNHIVSHDLKSPLVSIHSLTDLIERDLEDQLEERTQMYMDMLKESVTKMDASINGLLDYSKATKNEKEYAYIQLNDVLNGLISYIDFEHKIVVNLPQNNLEIYANQVEIEHVFQNLISNSIKYNDKEQTIIDIYAEKDLENNQYVFAVKDNGPGIPKKYHGKMFRIFNQAESSQKRKDSTGIGLAIVKSIIAKNFGEIKVESKENEGLKISFTWKMIHKSSLV